MSVPQKNIYKFGAETIVSRFKFDQNRGYVSLDGKDRPIYEVSRAGDLIKIRYK